MIAISVKANEIHAQIGRGSLAEDGAQILCTAPAVEGNGRASRPLDLSGREDNVG